MPRNKVRPGHKPRLISISKEANTLLEAQPEKVKSKIINKLILEHLTIPPAGEHT